ncbi:isoprenylcysteine carboxylmethyltransferase family protein [Mycolicibacterium sp. 018/SC-01/001]|uniref:methyltransferase family protein n=1 Tax=Mycolicibacterium sp. 018/SC-01/001 TaxID=2592069 RepID=UPI00117FF595|nr:isoprenylcysteine carboxylmethyltransferase family protein [Mycolicibacterium sp. 018/SC-01/001]TRW79319.1 isoprenylcysteine carboxylmethyltransferase family protein [Mycolicibacterium sp. 018/SC-01/001]
MKVILQAIASAVIGLVCLGAAVFIPAGTLRYWQGWGFIAVFTACSVLSGVYLALRQPDALARRVKAGPTAETRPAQRIIISLILVSVIATLAVGALDWRLKWSTVPVWLVVLGDILVAVGLIGAQLVVVQNNWAGASITVEDRQPLISTGLYGVVRHPMYSATLVMMAGVPLALGSLWGLAVVVLTMPLLAARILDEEKLLREGLAGYADYTQQVRFRLIPRVW